MLTVATSFVTMIGLFFISDLVPVTDVAIPIQTIFDSTTETFTPIYDPSINHPYILDKDASCPAWLLAVISLAFPMLTLALSKFFVCATTSSSSDEEDVEALISPPSPREASISQAYAAFFIGVGITESITQCVKSFVGRLRPNFYAICKYEFDEITGLGSCTASDIEIREGRSSFPSGHSSFSMFSSLFVVLFLLQRVDERREFFKGKGGAKMPYLRLVCASPLAVAVWVGASRVHDWWHFPSDVVTGSALGAAAAYGAFKFFYLDVIKDNEYAQNI